MAMLALLFEDEARREAPARRDEQPQARGRSGFWIATGLGCLLAALAGAYGASRLDTPQLDRFEVTLARGGTAQLGQGLEQLDQAPGIDSARARSARALALAQQAVWGGAPPGVVEDALDRGGDEGRHAGAASALLASLRGEQPASGSVYADWAAGVAQGWSLSDLGAQQGALAKLRARKRLPAGAARTLAALQFSLGDVSASLATLDRVRTAGAREDIAFYEAFVREDAAPHDGWAVPGRAELLRAWTSIRGGDSEAATAALAEARAQMLPWDPVATTTALRLSFLAGDTQGLQAWSKDDTRGWSASVRSLADGYAEATQGRWDAARHALAAMAPDGSRLPQAPWLAYVLGYAAAEQKRWPDAVRFASTARRGLPGRGELDVLAAWVATHFLDAGGSHGRLVTLSERSPWAPRVWTARAEAAQASGRPTAEVLASYERALQREHRPAGAAAALARHAEGEEAMHLWTMAVELEPSAAAHRVALALAQAERGRVSEAIRSFASVASADGDTWLTAAELALSTPELRPQVGDWIARAEQGNATPDRLARVQLRARLEQGEDVSSQARALLRGGDTSPHAAALAVLALGRAGRMQAARRVALRSRRRLDRAGSAQVSMALAHALQEHGEVREAAQLGFKAWASLRAESTPAWETLLAARVAIGGWLELGNTGGARAIARDLTERLPQSPDAWMLRARVQSAAEETEYVCRSLARARGIDPNIGQHGPGLKPADLARCDADPS